MAWFLAQRLRAGQADILGVYGRNDDWATALCDAYKLPRHHALTDIPDTADHCCILAVSDQSIATLAAALPFRHTLLLHTSGTVSINALHAADNGVLWPIYSLNKTALPQERNIPIAWEAGSAKAQQQIPEVAALLSDYALQVTAAQRQQLHLTAVLGNNFINHLLSIINQVCAEQALPAAMLQPIIAQTFLRSQQGDPALLQTGPARRNDQDTMQHHLELLNAHPEWQELYRSLSASIQKMYRQQN
jgi:hypothetical protein